MAGKGPAQTDALEQRPGVQFPVAAHAGHQVRVEGLGGIHQGHGTPLQGEPGR